MDLTAKPIILINCGSPSDVIALTLVHNYLPIVTGITCIIILYLNTQVFSLAGYPYPSKDFFSLKESLQVNVNIEILATEQVLYVESVFRFKLKASAKLCCDGFCQATDIKSSFFS